MPSNSYKLNSGMKCVKYMLFIINFMFMLTSILLILVGTTIRAIYNDFRQFIDLANLSSPTTLLIFIGVILLLVSAFGCFGALRESTLLINVYGLLLFLIFILEIATAITAFVHQGSIKGMVKRNMHESLKCYPRNPYIAEGVNFIQSNFHCCGVEKPNDWKNILEPLNDTEAGDIVLPQSCCFEDDKSYDEGCFNHIGFIISQSTMLLATGATTVAFVQILGVICAFMLAKTIRRTKSMRAARRWQLQQSLGILAKGDKSLHDSEYTQLEKSGTNGEPVTYEPTNPSENPSQRCI